MPDFYKEISNYNLFNSEDVVTGYYYQVNGFKDDLPDRTGYVYLPIHKVNCRYILTGFPMYGTTLYTYAVFDENKDLLDIKTGYYTDHSNTPINIYDLNTKEEIQNNDNIFQKNLCLTVDIPDDNRIKYFMYNIDYNISNIKVVQCNTIDEFINTDPNAKEEYKNFTSLDNINLPNANIEKYNEVINSLKDLNVYAKISINLYNPDDVEPGYYLMNNSMEIQSPNSATYKHIHIKIPEAGTYYFKFYIMSYGTTWYVKLINTNNKVVKIYKLDEIEAVYDKENRTWLVDKTIPLTVTVAITENDLQLGDILVLNTYSGEQMFCKDYYPETFIPYHDPYFTSNLKTTTDNIVDFQEKLIDVSARTIENHLYGKKIIFDGDSICHATVDSSWNGISPRNPDRKLGWAVRIGSPNAMDWYNYAVSGGVLVTGLYNQNGSERHWVSSYIDTIYQQHPTLDYYIFEGGTNDADLLGLNEENYGTLNLGDYTSGSYDTTKFIGAMDMICYKATHYWPTAKIGYIVAPKMGTGYTNFTAQYSIRRFYFEMAIDVCKKWGIPYLDLWDGCSMNPKNPLHYNSSLTIDQNKENGISLYYDGQHPTVAGYDYLAPIIEHWIRTL